MIKIQDCLNKRILVRKIDYSNDVIELEVLELTKKHVKIKHLSGSISWEGISRLKNSTEIYSCLNDYLILEILGDVETKPNKNIEAPSNITVTEGYKPTKENIHKDIIEEVFIELSMLSKKEFDKLIKEHANGDIAKALLRSGYFDKEKESQEDIECIKTTAELRRIKYFTLATMLYASNKHYTRDVIEQASRQLEHCDLEAAKQLYKKYIGKDW